MKAPENLPADLKELQARWPEMLENFLSQVHSPASMETVAEALRRDESFRNLVSGWERMPTAAQANCWEMIGQRLWRAALDSRPWCVRCGECCRRGSPVLFDQDRPALASGAIRRADLMTLRQGEPAFSNRLGRMILLEQEQVKIREQEDGRACIFLAPAGDACQIYDDRPFQCRVMECWDPSRFDTLTRMRPLNRRDLILFDLHLRNFALEKLHLEETETDFLFGRPLAALVGAFGFGIETGSAGGLKLVRLAPETAAGQR